ncbi:hypothetical protein EVAR_30012_1 [Eumeta japonica]|uniref:Uncharacterized protein n=1 Tax=Eumeta variegata TaxID=151549 RepID=A0A4C1VW00_EUMVA|nr:hypothetical protein EVAR_30012_1 [Eumeta japonica]
MFKRQLDKIRVLGSPRSRAADDRRHRNIDYIWDREFNVFSRTRGYNFSLKKPKNNSSISCWSELKSKSVGPQTMLPTAAPQPYTGGKSVFDT